MSAEKMGCYKLTYHYEPKLFLQEQGEKIDTLKWHVTVNAGSKLGEADDKVLTKSGTPWMPFAIAYATAKLTECQSQVGKTAQEIAKMESDNMLILQMLAASNQTPNGLNSGSNSNAWCASFVNWCLGLAGIEGTGSPGAGSFIGWGDKIDKPVYGAIGVQVNAAGEATHVGFYAGESGIATLPVSLLGGNQGWGTCVRYSPMSSTSFTYWCLPPGYGTK
ncbi:MAG: hypothetical protein JSR37_10430 [Verrucomicrobia bacterium]|nr:hypothetical protein [Verrucomicrobiota bacterium]